MVSDRRRYQQRAPRFDDPADPPPSPTDKPLQLRHSPTRLRRPDLPAPSGGLQFRRSADRPTVAPGTSLWLQVDATPGLTSDGMAGISIVVRRHDGQIIRWHLARAPARTSNEAEYQAIIAGLAFMHTHFPMAAVQCFTDSKIAADQLNGRCALRAHALKPLHQHAQQLRQQFATCAIHAIPREYNRLADALAWEALTGQHKLVMLLGGASWKQR